MELQAPCQMGMSPRAGRHDASAADISACAEIATASRPVFLDRQSNLAQAGIPLMVLDAWEHAYYLQYENRKAEFFEAAWNVWNWRDISDRFAAARLVSIALVDARR